MRKVIKGRVASAIHVALWASLGLVGCADLTEPPSGALEPPLPSATSNIGPKADAMTAEPLALAYTDAAAFKNAERLVAGTALRPDTVQLQRLRSVRTASGVWVCGDTRSRNNLGDLSPPRPFIAGEALVFFLDENADHKASNASSVLALARRSC